ncbi:MAG: hypothetical protein JWO30_2036 [Fibrobacteres bacterium]|nr:hypothetical protein [Fibrobacterota bacterium]
MSHSFARYLLTTAGIVMVLTKEGHVGVTSLNKLKLGELAGRANIIVMAIPLKPFEQKETITYMDSTNRIPPLEDKAFRFKREDVLKNDGSMDLPDTFVVFDYYTEIHSRGHVLAHTSGEMESPITYYYDGPIKETNLGKEKSVLLFLSVIHDDPIASPRDRLGFTANHAYEKASKAKAVTKLVANPEFPPRPKSANPNPPHHPK